MRISDWSSDVCSSDLRLIDEFSLTHQQAADAVGRSRASVSNLLRLLDLPPDVRRLLEQHAIEMGHARALLALPAAAACALAREAAERGMSVRAIERRVPADRTGVVSGKSVSVRVDLGGRR